MAGTTPWVAQANVEPIAAVTIQAIANSALYNVVSGCDGTYSGANMNLTLAAGSITHNSTVTAVAGNAVTLVSDPSNPRWTYTYINSSGTAVLVSGSAAATPAVPDPGANVTAQLTYVQAALTIASSATYKLDKRVMATPAASLQSATQYFVESSGYKAFAALGACPNSFNDTISITGTAIGLGFTTLFGGTSAHILTDNAANVGMWKFSTGTTSGQNAGVVGPGLSYLYDWTMEWRGIIPSSANQTVFMGQKASLNFSDENQIIGFRVSGTGNIIGVCDNAGTETTRDSGATGAVECTLRIEVRSNGTIVRFYRNNTQIGADVTTNIPTDASQRSMCGIINATTADKTMSTSDLDMWREIA